MKYYNQSRIGLGIRSQRFEQSLSALMLIVPCTTEEGKKLCITSSQILNERKDTTKKFHQVFHLLNLTYH